MAKHCQKLPGFFSSSLIEGKISMYDLKLIISTSNFHFGTPKKMYQSKAFGVVGGVLGRNNLLKFHHKYADFSA